MSFYYGKNEPPEEEPKPSWREVFMLIVVTFRVLAMPLAVIFGAILGFFVLVWLFTLNPMLGLGAILLIIGAIAVRAIWEWRNPPSIDKIRPR